MKKTVAVLQARTTSRRLPGKVLKPIMGRPMLAYQIDRILRARAIDTLIVATSVDPSDDAIAALCHELNISCYRGSLPDVMERVYLAAQSVAATQVVRLTGDCPLLDPALIDATIALHEAQGNDYTCNCDPATYPDGLDTEVCSMAALSKAQQLCDDLAVREHATWFLRLHPELFQLGVLKNDIDYSAERWTVDEPEDFLLVSRIFETLYPQNPAFSWLDVLELLKQNPQWRSLNAHHIRNSQLAGTGASS